MRSGRIIKQVDYRPKESNLITHFIKCLQQNLRKSIYLLHSRIHHLTTYCMLSPFHDQQSLTETHCLQNFYLLYLSCFMFPEFRINHVNQHNIPPQISIFRAGLPKLGCEIHLQGCDLHEEQVHHCPSLQPPLVSIFSYQYQNINMAIHGL